MIYILIWGKFHLSLGILASNIDNKSYFPKNI